MERLRTELAELKLVLEQQDRDMERMRGLLLHLRAGLDDKYAHIDRRSILSDLDAILNPETPCTTTK